jgi:signal transduction histidine kinase
VGATAVLVLALLVGAFTAAWLLRRSLTSDVETQLIDRIDVVELSIDQGLLVPVLEPTGRDIGQVQVIDAEGRVIAVTPGLAGTTRLDAIEAPAVGQQRVATIRGGEIEGDPEEQFRIVARTVSTPLGDLTIYAVSSLDGAVRAERFLRNALLVGFPLVVVFSSMLTYRLVGRALAPVDAMRAEVDRIEATDLSGRVTALGSDDEIARLGATLNRMLARLEESATGQRLFAAAASHELRSPLSAIRTELEVGIAYPERADWSTIAHDALTEVDRLEVLARDLLVLTRSRATVSAEIHEVDLAAVVAVELARRRSGGVTHYVEDLTPVTVMADENAVVRVLRNLLDNADRHARSTVSVRVVGGVGDERGAVLTVANDGEPIPDSELEGVFEPFRRLDEARALDDGGSGLGLAIARTIMSANGGTLVADRVERGASFSARFSARFSPTVSPIGSAGVSAPLAARTPAR